MNPGIAARRKEARDILDYLRRTYGGDEDELLTWYIDHLKDRQHNGETANTHLIVEFIELRAALQTKYWDEIHDGRMARMRNETARVAAEQLKAVKLRAAAQRKRAKKRIAKLQAALANAERAALR